MKAFTKALGLSCVLASGALAFASACGSDDDDGVAVVPDGGGDATTVLADGAVSSGLADGQIYQVLLTFNQGEILEATTAGTQGSSIAVRNLAEQFDGDYQNIDAKLVMLAGLTKLVPGTSDQANALAAQTTADETMFTPLSGAAFDSAYLTAQVTELQSLLTLIDSVLAPSVVNVDLAGIVGTERALVAGDLAEAQALQDDAGALDAGTEDASLDAGADATVDASDASDGGEDADATDAADADADPDADAAADAADAADADDGSD